MRVPPPAATPLPAGAPAHELNLVGGSPLEAPSEVIDYVKGKGTAGAPVRVRVGAVAAGQIVVRAHGSQLVTPKTQGITLLLPLFNPLRAAGIDPVLALDVHEKGVVGYASVRKGNNVQAKAAGLREELRKNATLIGWAGLERLSLPDLTNELQDTKLVLRCTGLTFGIGGFLTGSGSFGMTNEVVTFTATATGTVPGLATITVPIERTEDGSLTGKVAVDLTIKGFSGQVEASYAHGVVDVIGTVRYANEKFDGSVTIAATDKDSATALTAAHTPAEVKSVAPAAEGATPQAGAASAKPAAAPDVSAGPGPGSASGAAVAAKSGPRVLVGWGTVNIQLAEWLSGQAMVVVGPAGHVTVVGKITPKMTKPLFEQRKYQYPLPKVEVRAIYGVPIVGNVFVFANIGLAAEADLGPATLTNMEMVGTWSTDPKVLQNFALTGTLNISAFAGLRLTAEGGAGIQIADHDIKVGVALGALAGIRGYVDATPRIGYREVADPAAGKKGEFYIGGHLDIAAQPFLQLSGDLFVDLDSPWWSPAPDKRWTWPLGRLEYPLPGEFGIGADVEHVLGSGKMPEIQFGKVDFNAERFMTDLVDDHVPPKKSVDEKKKGGWKESQPAGPSALKAVAGAPPGKQLPKGPPGAPPKVAGAGPKPAAAGAPKAGGPSGKSAKDATQTPKPQNDAAWKAGVAGFAEVLKGAKSNPLSDAEMAAALGKLKAKHKFTSAEATRVGDHWHLKAAMNPTIEGDAGAEKGDATTATAAQTTGQGVPVEFSAPPDSKIVLQIGNHKGKTVRFIEVVALTPAQPSGPPLWLLRYTFNGRPYGTSVKKGVVAFLPAPDQPAETKPRKPRVENASSDRGRRWSGEVGVSAYKSPTQSPPGWDVLGAGSAAWWTQSHLLNGKLDGPGLRWNLAITPVAVNNAMKEKFEQILVPAAHSGKRFFMDAKVEYHQHGDKATDVARLVAVNSAFDVTHFPKTVGVTYYSLKEDGTKDQDGAPFLSPVRLPREDELDGYRGPSEPPTKAVQPTRRRPEQ